MFHRLAQYVLLLVLLQVVSGFACSGPDDDCWDFLSKARHTTSAAELDSLVRDSRVGDGEVLAAVTFNPYTSSNTLLRMATNTDISSKECDGYYKTVGGWAVQALMKRDLAGYMADLVNSFAFYSNADIRAAYASEASNTEYLGLLAHDTVEMVRAFVAANKHAPESALDHLSYDTSSWVRANLPEFWQYWRRIPDQKNLNFPRYISHTAVGISGVNYTLWFNLAASSKSTPIPRQYDITCLGHTFKQVGTSGVKAAAPGSPWYKIIEHVCTSYTTHTK